MSISAKSAASTPPAPARIVMTAGRSSHSPSSSVCTSRSPMHFCSAGELDARVARGLLVAGLLGELDEHLEVVEARVDALHAGELGLAVAERARHLLGLLGVVPQVWRARLLREASDLRLEGVDVDDGTDVAEGGAQRGDLLREVKIQHGLPSLVGHGVHCGSRRQVRMDVTESAARLGSRDPVAGDARPHRRARRLSSPPNAPASPRRAGALGCSRCRARTDSGAAARTRRSGSRPPTRCCSCASLGSPPTRWRRRPPCAGCATA